VNGEGQFRLADLFFIDDGELDGLSNAKCFLLGAEWFAFRSVLLTTEEAFEQLITSDNVERILKLCWNHHRPATHTPETDGWHTIHVPACRPHQRS
jgi:hypothetical protein